MEKSARKEKVYLHLPCQIFFRKLCTFRIEIRRTVLKQPIRIEYLIKQKLRGAFALQINIGPLAEEKGLTAEVGSCQSFFL